MLGEQWAGQATACPERSRGQRVRGMPPSVSEASCSLFRGTRTGTRTGTSRGIRTRSARYATLQLLSTLRHREPPKSPAPSSGTRLDHAARGSVHPIPRTDPCRFPSGNLSSSRGESRGHAERRRCRVLQPARCAFGDRLLPSVWRFRLWGCRVPLCNRSAGPLGGAASLSLSRRAEEK